MTPALPCTTKARKRKHLATFLAPTAGTRGIGRMGETLCGQTGAMDQECVDNPDWQWKRSSKPIKDLPMCGSCDIAERKRQRESYDAETARHALTHMERVS